MHRENIFTWHFGYTQSDFSGYLASETVKKWPCCSHIMLSYRKVMMQDLVQLSNTSSGGIGWVFLRITNFHGFYCRIYESMQPHRLLCTHYNMHKTFMPYKN